MGNISKRHDVVLKTKVALEAIKREKTILERYTGSRGDKRGQQWP